MKPTTTITIKMLYQYQNGNAEVTLYKDGTRIVECEGDLNLNCPLNIDIRLSEQCAFGLNKKTGKAICDFCHESATTDGNHGDLKQLIKVLSPLPAGIELAVGINQINSNVEQFLSDCCDHGWVVNVTVNQGHIPRDGYKIKQLLGQNLINGLGISYRAGMKPIAPELLAYENTVVHVINGIDSFDEVKKLSTQGVQKILVLGEKDFGFNVGKVKLTTHSHMQWYKRIYELFKLFKVVSFDNLALEQLNVKRFVKDWNTVYQHEFSFYINSVQKYFSPSSRSNEKVSYNDMSVIDYFRTINGLK